MRTSEIQTDLKTKHVIEQLNSLDYYDTDGLTYDELVRKLATLRTMEVEVGNPGGGWF